jgi:CHU_C Type IX secretion signal domain
MKTEDELYNEIEQFLNKDLKAPALKSFKEKVAQDPELDYQVKLQGMANDLVIKNRLAQVAELSKSIQKQELAKQQYIKYGRMGALVVAVGISGYFLVDQLAPKPSNVKNESKSMMQVTQPNHDTILGSTVVIPKQPQTPITAEVHKNNTDSKAAEKDNPIVKENANPVLEQLSSPSKDAEHKDITIIKEKTEPNTTIPKVAHKEEVPCKGVVLKATIHGFETCEGASEGSVSVSKIQGGQEPYHYKLISKLGHIESALTNLSEGKYTLTVTDGKNCTQVFDNIVIAAKKCNVDLQFNPQLGETWDIPSVDKAGELSIYDGSGHLVFKKQISASESVTWDGKTLEGQIQSGVFVYLLKYTDGSQRQGNITVLQ